MKLTIGHLYPDLLNLYGDRGNIQCMMKRLQWRGIEAETIEFEIQDEVDFSELDIVLLGGGSDREQMLVCERLKEIRDDFKAYVEDGGVVLAVCGGYQLLGTHYSTDQGVIEGLSIVDIYTEQGKDYRLIDNIVLESELSDMPVVGFENHGGRTYKHLHLSAVQRKSQQTAGSGTDLKFYLKRSCRIFSLRQLLFVLSLF